MDLECDIFEFEGDLVIVDYPMHTNLLRPKIQNTLMTTHALDVGHCNNKILNDETSEILNMI